jgi:hypothetical protein
MDKLIRVRLVLAALRFMGLSDLSTCFQSVAKAIAPTPPGVQSTDWTAFVQVPQSLIDGFRTTPSAPAISRPLRRLQLLLMRSFTIPPRFPVSTPPTEDR